MNAYACVLSSDIVVSSVYRDQLVRCVSLLIKRTLVANVDIVNVDSGGEC